MDARALIVIVLAGIGTFLIRGCFWLLADRVREVPDSVRTALTMIPPAALAALIAPALLRPEGVLSPLGPRALAGVVAIVVAVWTRSVLWTIVIGLVAVMALQALLGA